jgi:type II secretory pathway pseudopilin PulG
MSLIRLKKGLSLLEIIVIIVIVGIMAVFAIPGLWKTRVKAYDKEARTQLMQIQHAQKMRHLKIGEYAGCDTMVECESALDLDFPPAPPTGYWNYTIPTATVPADGSNYCAQACHTGGNARCWHITKDDDLTKKGVDLSQFEGPC